MRFRLVILFALLATACTRTLDQATGPATATTTHRATATTADSTGPMIYSIFQYPMQDYLDSLLALNQDSFMTVMQSVYGLYQPGTQNPGQAEIGYAFRTERKGYIFALGVCLPTTGCRHTVTVWDSATGQVISQSHVETSTVGWNYNSDFQIGPQANLIPHHGYVIGFDSKADGVPINTWDSRNSMYMWDGIVDWEPGGTNKAMYPFRWEGVTFEGWYILNYNTPQSSPPFPGTQPLQNAVWENGFFGACNLAFAPQ